MGNMLIWGDRLKLRFDLEHREVFILFLSQQVTIIDM